MSFDDFLKDGKSQELPSSDNVFVPSGLIAPTSAGQMWWFMSQNKVDAPGCQVDQRKDWYHYFGENYDAVSEASSRAKEKYDPSKVWVFEQHNDEVLNFGEGISEIFGDVINHNVRIVTLMSKKRRHGLHLLTLPAAVAAYAKAKKWDCPTFDVWILLSKETDLTDYDTMYALIGDPDQDNDADHEHNMWNSLFGLQRKAIWKALGEEDPAVYKGSHTNAPKLKEALRIIEKTWGTPMWANVVTVPDPFISDKNLPRIPLLMEFYLSEENAKKAAKADLARRGGSSDDESDDVELPDVPVAYVEDDDCTQEDFLEYVRDEASGKPKHIALRNIEKELGLSKSEAKAWHACL